MIASSLGLAMSCVHAAEVALNPANANTTDVDWGDTQALSSASVEKFFTGDLGENLSLKLTLTPGGSSANVRWDGYGARLGLNPDGGGAGPQSYRWADGEILLRTVAILDKDNGDADVTGQYDVLLSSIVTANNGSI